MPSHVGINVTGAARDELRALKFALTGAAGRSVTLSDALTVAARFAREHIDQATRYLDPPEGQE